MPKHSLNVHIMSRLSADTRAPISQIGERVKRYKTITFERSWDVLTWTNSTNLFGDQKHDALEELVAVEGGDGQIEEETV